MYRRHSLVVLLTLLVAAQTPAVFFDTFDTLSPEWEFLPAETAAELIHDVSGGQFRAFGFTEALGGNGHSARMRRSFADQGTPGLQNLSLFTRVNLPLTEYISQVRILLMPFRQFGGYGIGRAFSIRNFGAGHLVSIGSGSASNNIVLSNLPSILDVEIRNMGPTASLYLNGSFILSSTDSQTSNLNPSFGAVEMHYRGFSGSSTPVSLDYIQVVPEPATLVGLSLAALAVLKKGKRPSGRGDRRRPV